MDILWKTPGILLKHSLDPTDAQRIQALAEICQRHDGIALKLELDYKLADAQARTDHGILGPVREFLYLHNNQLIGYLGIGCFGGDVWEVTGMVHPGFRGQGIFSKLYRQFLQEKASQDPSEVLLLCDRNSLSGKACLKTTGARLDHSEHEMFLSGETDRDPDHPEIFLRKAGNEDISEIRRQNRIYFGLEPMTEQSQDEEVGPDFPALIPEEEEKRGMTIYLAQRGTDIIGKVHIQRGSEVWGIFGLGVLPEYRSQGFGRAILSLAVQRMKEEGAPAIMLQVDADNDRALGLYLSCGFRETSVMDYYTL